jgi:fructose-1,6-bisphosphatase/inositol monophosphatase family enzyme
MGTGFGYVLATGRAEIAMDCAVSVWDCAPIKAIIEGAGGVYSDFAGSRLTLASAVFASNGVSPRRSA